MTNKKDETYDLKKIIKKAVEQIKKIIPINNNYNDNFINMYITHIIPYLIFNKSNKVSLKEIKYNLNNFIESKCDNLDSMLSEYASQLDKQITCPCRK